MIKHCFFSIVICCFCIGASHRTVGNLIPRAQCKVGSQVSGRVHQVKVDVGEKVVKGQLLVIVDKALLANDLAQNQAHFASAKLELVEAKTNHERMHALWERQSVSLKQFEEAKTRFERAKLELEKEEVNVKRSQILLDETEIKAPFDGVIANRLVDEGAMVSGVTYLLEMQDIDPLYLEFSLPQAYLNKVHAGMPITFEVEGSNVEKHHAKIDRISPCLDQDSRSFRCRAIIVNKNYRFSPGSMATVEVEVQ